MKGQSVPVSPSDGDGAKGIKKIVPNPKTSAFNKSGSKKSATVFIRIV